MQRNAYRVVIGADTFPPDVNGAARFAHRLATGLAGRGHDVHVVAASPTGPAAVEHTDGITVHRLASYRTGVHPTFRVCPPWLAAAATRGLLRELSPDLVHVQAHFSVGRGLAKAASQAGVPLVATNHFMPENLFGYAKVPGWLRTGAARWAWRDLVRVYRKADAVTAPTPRAVQLLHDNGLPPVATPISCGIDLDRYAAARTGYRRPELAGRAEPAGPGRRGPEPSGRGEHATVLFVGRLDEEKRVDELLRAMALLPPWVRAEIVGDGAYRQTWQRLAADLRLTDRVTFHGYVDDAALLEAYARCDVFCMPGIAELQSLVTLEAMAAGKPVVAADAMALPHLVRPGENGYLFPPGDVAALADRLIEVLADPGVTARMGVASRRIVASHDLAATLDAYEDVYERVTGRIRVPLPVAA
ncbi:MAG: glycosyltransferase [Micromonosporaceae bacterium]